MIIFQETLIDLLKWYANRFLYFKKKTHKNTHLWVTDVTSCLSGDHDPVHEPCMYLFMQWGLNNWQFIRGSNFNLGLTSRKSSLMEIGHDSSRVVIIYWYWQKYVHLVQYWSFKPAQKLSCFVCIKMPKLIVWKPSRFIEHPFLHWFELHHDKTNNMACASSED